MTKYDDLWTNTTHFQNLANVTTLSRNYPTYPISPDLNFPPDQDYMNRVVAQLRLETTQVDAVMFRITSGKIPDELIKRAKAGVPVRLITDPTQYRTETYFWDSYNVDRMYMEGVDVKWKKKTNPDVPKLVICIRSQSFSMGGNSRSSGHRTGRLHHPTRSGSTTISHPPPPLPRIPNR